MVAVLVSGPAAARAAGPIPSNTAAVVAREPLTKMRLDHWMWIAGKTQAAQTPGAPVIIATDPPRFARCIAEARREIPSLANAPQRDLKRDCHRLFLSMSGQVMDFLIRARWYEAQADQDHIVITQAQALHAFRKAKREQFRSRGAWTQFLRLTGQTVSDMVFRFRINLIYEALLKREHVRPSALEAKVQAAWRSSTVCGRYYVMYDCGNSPQNSPPPGSGAGSFSGSFF